MTYSDGTNSSDFKKMSPEDRKFLEDAMKENMIRDDPKRMSEIMMKVKEILTMKPSNDGSADASSSSLSFDIDTVLDDFEELRDIVEQVDMAMLFTKYGGCELLVRFMELSVERESSSSAVSASSVPFSPSSLTGPAVITLEMRSLAASIIATVSQNHLTVQDLLLKQGESDGGGIMDRLVGLFLAADNNSPFASKLLYALSCLVRGHPVAEEYFVMKCADQVFSKIFSSSHLSLPLVSRALFLANALIMSDFSSNTRIAKLALLCVPFCVSHLLQSSSLSSASLSPSSSSASSSGSRRDVNDNVYLLLSTLLQTAPGYVMILNPQSQSTSSHQSSLSPPPSYAMALSEFFAACEKAGEKERAKKGKKGTEDADADDEEAEYEHEKVQREQLKALLSSPLTVAFPSKIAEENSRRAVEGVLLSSSSQATSETAAMKKNHYFANDSSLARANAEKEKSEEKSGESQANSNGHHHNSENDNDGDSNGNPNGSLPPPNPPPAAAPILMLAPPPPSSAAL
jgi:hypothetical protein